MYIAALYHFKGIYMYMYVNFSKMALIILSYNQSLLSITMLSLQVRSYKSQKYLYTHKIASYEIICNHIYYRLVSANNTYHATVYQ